MSRRDIYEFWFYNEGFNHVGHIMSEDEANRLAVKDHLIIFRATPRELEEAGVY